MLTLEEATKLKDETECFTIDEYIIELGENSTEF